MEKYQIKLVSKRNSIILILLILIFVLGGAIIFKQVAHQNPFIFTLLSGIITYFLWQKFVIGRTEWIVNEKGINITWIKQFYFNSEEDMSLEWNEIENISRGPDPNYYTLRITLSTGEKIDFYHDTLTTKDDFKKFIKVLNQTFTAKKSNQKLL